jgi:hypothetical protein
MKGEESQRYHLKMTTKGMVRVTFLLHRPSRRNILRASLWILRSSSS